MIQYVDHLFMTNQGDSERVVSLDVKLIPEQSIESISESVYDSMEYLFNSRGRTRKRLAAYAMIKAKAVINWRDLFNSTDFPQQYLRTSLLPSHIAQQRLREMIQYAADIKRGDIFPYPILMKQGNMLIQADGARRIIAHKLAGKTEMDIILVLERRQISKILEPEFIADIQQLQDRQRWFDSYQDIVELNISGSRKAMARFPCVLDFSCCKNKTVVDFGCSTGHTLFEAYYSGATKCIGFEYIQINVDIINRLAQRLSVPVKAYRIDFNDPGFENAIQTIIPEWDYGLFLSVYRTRELIDRNDLLQFIWEHTKTGLFFEGHSEPMDTEEFYAKVFSQLSNSNVSFLGTTSDLGIIPRRNYLIQKMGNKSC